MSWLYDIAKELFPVITDSIRDGYRGFRSSRRRRLHIFMLKAMGYSSSTLAPVITGRRFDLVSIDQNLYMTQIEDAAGDKETIAKAALQLHDPEDEKKWAKGLKRQKKMGIPELHDPKRRERIEEILYDMVDAGKLDFHPPNMWSVK